MTVSLPAPRSVLSNESSLSQPDAAHLDSSPASESPPRAHWHLTPIDENVDAEHQHDDDGRDYVEEEYVDYGDQLYSDQLAGDALQVGDNDVDVHGVQVDDERELNHVDILLQNQLPPPTSASSQLIDFHSQFTDGTTGGGGGGASGTQQTLVVSSQVDGPRHVHFSQSTRGGEPAWGELHGVVSAVLYKSEYIIGRHRTCDFRLPNIEVSNRHCRIYRDDFGSVFLQDLSSNGTRVRGVKVGKDLVHELQHQDSVEIMPDAFFIFTKTEQAVEQSIQSKYIKDYFVTDIGLGSGAFGMVMKAVVKTTGKQLACKIIEKRIKQNGKLVNRPRIQLDNIQREVEIHMQMQHPNIVNFLDFIVSPHRFYVFLELLPGGDLMNYLELEGAMSEREAKFVFFQQLLAVDYLHQRNVTHRDIKPDNFLMEICRGEKILEVAIEEETCETNADPSSAGSATTATAVAPPKTRIEKRPKSTAWTRVCLTDFGFAKVPVQNQRAHRLKTLCGTTVYLAPEILMPESYKKGYTSAVDCWALGAVLCILLTAHFPFGEDPKGNAAGQLALVQQPIAFDHPMWAPTIRDLVLGLLEVNPRYRLTVAEALAHPWIANDRHWLDEIYRRVVLKEKEE